MDVNGSFNSATESNRKRGLPPSATGDQKEKEQQGKKLLRAVAEFEPPGPLDIHQVHYSLNEHKYIDSTGNFSSMSIR